MEETRGDEVWDHTATSQKKKKKKILSIPKWPTFFLDITSVEKMEKVDGKWDSDWASCLNMFSPTSNFTSVSQTCPEAKCLKQSSQKQIAK